MNSISANFRSEKSGKQSLFSTDVEVQILLSVHLLGKPTAAQLFRLHEREVSTLRRMQGILRRLSSGPDRMLNVINPMDIHQPIRSLSYVYLDTTRSRRFLEERFNVPFRRVPPVPSRDWRFLRHDVSLVDDLVAFELAAREKDLPFGYVPHIDANGKHFYPKVTISHDGLVHTLRPKPDATLLVGDRLVILEHDCGEETIECGNIIRDATIGRKQLVYDALLRSDPKKWNGAIVTYLMEQKFRRASSTKKRIRRCIDTFPDIPFRGRFYFYDCEQASENNESILASFWNRADDRMRPLPV